MQLGVLSGCLPANVSHDIPDNPAAPKTKKFKVFCTTLNFFDEILVAREGFEPPTLRV